MDLWRKVLARRDTNPLIQQSIHPSIYGRIPKLVSAAGFAPAIARAQTEIVGRYTTRLWRTRRELHPQPSRRQRGALLIELRVQNGMPSRSLGTGWWEALVTLQFVASDSLFSDSRFTVGRPDHLPEIGSPSRSAKEVYEILSCGPPSRRFDVAAFSRRLVAGVGITPT